MEKKLGVEIEFTGVTRQEVVTALEYLFNTEAIKEQSKTTDDKYFYHKIKDNYGGTWLVVRDKSIKPQYYQRRFLKEDLCDRFEVTDSTSTDYMVELVSPALDSKSLPLLFTIVDIIKSLGGIVNSSCGIHIHIDKPDNYNDIVDLFKKFCLEQDNILQFFDVAPWRLEKYCKPYDISLLDKDTFTDEKDFLNSMFRAYAEVDESTGTIIKRTSRYYALNFYSLRQHNTIEFRLFNSSLNRVEIAKILDWVLHFVYTYEDYSSYIPVLGSILMNELKEE